MVILTNIERFPPEWRAPNGVTGTSETARTLADFLKKSRRADVLLINCDPRLVLQLSAVFTVLPFLRRPIVAADLVLREPEGLLRRISAFGKRILLRRVDHFIHYFKDLSGFQRFYGVGPDRSSFVPFRPTLRYKCETPAQSDGDYILCFGWSLRDFDTFFSAIERLPYPAAIPEPDFSMLQRHSSRFTRTLAQLPAQVQLIPHDASNYQSQANLISKARLVVVPMLKSCMVGVTTPLNAMLLGKCVIMSDGPQTRGLFTDELLTVPPEDATALADVIRRAWEDRELRCRTAEAGYKYALTLGGEPELRQRFIDATVSWLVSRAGHSPQAS